jgi:hypothetical protein
MGIQTGIDLDKMVSSAQFISQAIQAPIDSNTTNAYLKRQG